MGPHVSLPSGAPLEFVCWAIWKLIDSRIDRLCELCATYLPVESEKTIRGFLRRELSRDA